MLHDLPAKFHRLDLILGRRTARDDVVLDASDSFLGADIGILDEEAADDGTNVTVGGGNLLKQSHETEIFLFLKECAGVGRELRGNDHFAEDLGNGAGQSLVDGAVCNDDATKGGGTICGEGLLPCLGEVPVATDATNSTGVGVLEDGDGRLGKLAHQAGRRRDIKDVVEGKFLTVELLEVVKEVSIQFGLLVRVLTVAETSGERKLEGDGFTGGALVIEVGTDGAIVGAGGREGLHRKAGAKFGGRRAVAQTHGLENTGVVGGIDDDGDRAVVFGSTADHGWAADIDLLDGLLKGDALLRNGLFEGVKIHADQVDRQDAVCGSLGLMLFIIAEEEKAAVDLRDQGLHAAIHHFREAGVVGDFPDGNAGRGDRLGCAAGGKEFDTKSGESAGEVYEAGLVRDREEGALNFHAGNVGWVTPLGKNG